MLSYTGFDEKWKADGLGLLAQPVVRLVITVVAWGERGGGNVGGG